MKLRARLSGLGFKGASLEVINYSREHNVVTMCSKDGNKFAREERRQ